MHQEVPPSLPEAVSSSLRLYRHPHSCISDLLLCRYSCGDCGHSFCSKCLRLCGWLRGRGVAGQHRPCGGSGHTEKKGVRGAESFLPNKTDAVDAAFSPRPWQGMVKHSFPNRVSRCPGGSASACHIITRRSTGQRTHDDGTASSCTARRKPARTFPL